MSPPVNLMFPPWKRSLDVKLFKREAQTLARLKHPSIAAIYEMGRTDDGQHFIAMELVRVETLDVWLKHHEGIAGCGSESSANCVLKRRRARTLGREIDKYGLLGPLRAHPSEVRPT